MNNDKMRESFENDYIVSGAKRFADGNQDYVDGSIDRDWKVQSRPHITRSKIRMALSTSLQRIERLEREGLVKLPLKMNSSIGATLGRKAGGWGNGFKVKG